MKLPVHLLTGFLGSGKTTLLNALLKDAGFSDSAVVVNEFGDIGLDHLLMSSAKENVVLMASGCLCCAVLDSLPETLVDLFGRRARAETPPFARVFIETTGLADPLPILRTLMKGPLVAHFYRTAGVVCVVDGVFGARTLEHHAEARAQAAIADRIVVTKMDLAGGVPAPLRARIRRLNRHAPIMTFATGAPGITELFAGMADPLPIGWVGNAGLAAAGLGSATLAAPRVSTATVAAPRLSTAGAAVGVHASPHDPEIASVSIRIEEPLTWAGIAAWTAFLGQRLGPSLLRCKGILNVQGYRGPVVLHGVQGAFDIERRAEWPDAERRSRLVLIGRALPAAELEDSVSRLFAEPGVQLL